MKIVVTTIAIVIGLLALAAGAAKIARVPQEVEFLGQFGFSTGLIVSFGILQVIGGLLIVFPRTRLHGALVTAAGFALSAVLVLLAGNLVFAGVSLVPLVLAGFVAFRSYSGQAPSDGASPDS